MYHFSALVISPSAAASYPELVVCDPVAPNGIVLTPPIRYPLQLRYAAAPNLLAFSGEIDGDLGVYVINLATRKLFRLWKDQDNFSFSPDGRSLMLVDREVANGEVAFLGLVEVRLPTDVFVDE